MKMRNRLGYAIVVTFLGTSVFLSACNDDEDDPGDTNGGENAGGEPSTGGTGAGKSGSTNGGSTSGASGAGGRAGSSTGGSMTDAGAGGMSDAGAAGDGGMGGAAAGMGGANVGGAEGGAAGAGGAENPVVTYACSANSIAHKACSAKAAEVTCTAGVECPDCVALVQAERDDFAECATCLAELDKMYQCAIDAHESGNLSEGVVCLETGPDTTEPDYADACYEFYFTAVTCQGYASDPAHGCPSTWPPPG
jgi:hypothetical protein